jgi:hypothetical protein
MSSCYSAAANSTDSHYYTLPLLEKGAKKGAKAVIASEEIDKYFYS